MINNVLIIVMLSLCLNAIGISGKDNILNTKTTMGISLLKDWNIEKTDIRQVKILYKAKGEQTFGGLPEAVNISGTGYWIVGKREFRTPLSIHESKPVYLLMRLYATGSAGFYSLSLGNNKETFEIKLPCYPRRWQTCIVKINDMRSLSRDISVFSPAGKKLKWLKISQRCILGDEKKGKKGKTISPEHAFTIGEVKIFNSNAGIKEVEELIQKLLPDPFYRGKLIQALKINGDIKIWTAPSVIRVFRDSPLPRDNADTIKISAPKDSWESFQVVVNSKLGGETAMLSVSDLTNTENDKKIPASEIDIYPVEYVHLTIGANGLPVKRWYPDPLSRNKSVKLKAGKNQPFWVSCHIPRNTFPGIYHGTLKLTTGKNESRIPLKIKVWDFALPFSPHFQSNLQIWNSSKKYWKMQEMLGRYKLYDANLWFKTSSENRKILVEKYGQNTVKLAGAMGHGTKNPLNFKKAKFGTNEYAKKLSDYIDQRMQMLKPLGMENKAYVYIWDEPMGDFAVIDNMVKICKIIKKANPKTKILAASGAFKPLVGYVDYFAADYCENLLRNTNNYKSQPYSFWRGARPPLIQQSPLSIRLYGFENWKFNFTGCFFWGISVWDNKSLLPQWYDPWKHIGQGFRLGVRNGIGLLIYPGNVPQSKSDIPCYSIRLEMLRDMVTDYECLYMLDSIKQQNSNIECKQEIDNVINECLSMICAYNKYENNPEKYYKLRTKIAETIVKYKHNLKESCSAKENCD